jgi:8-oxo-dGTP pyrophosphatase MutT (NUDIX family)
MNKRQRKKVREREMMKALIKASLEPKKVVPVVAAIIVRDGRVFATQRGYGDFKDGWEFPGGKIEAGETPQEAAVREMTEELLVSPQQIELLGPGDLLVGDAVRIYSFVARLHGYDGRFSKDEVAEVFEVPLRFFLDTKPDAYEIGWKPDFPADFPFEKIYGGRDYQWGSHAYTVLFYEYGDHVIWGMTAKITNAFAALCRREGL